MQRYYRFTHAQLLESIESMAATHRDFGMTNTVVQIGAAFGIPADIAQRHADFLIHRRESLGPRDRHDNWLLDYTIGENYFKMMEVYARDLRIIATAVADGFEDHGHGYGLR